MEHLALLSSVAPTLAVPGLELHYHHEVESRSHNDSKSSKLG